MQNSGPARGRSVFLLLSAALALPLALGTLGRAVAEARGEREDSIYKHLSVFTEVVSLVQRGYVDEISVPSLFAGAFEGIADALDPFATYVPEDEVDRYRRSLDLGAAHTGLTVARSGGISYVVAVEDGSPAMAAGMQRGDVVAAVGGESTREMPLWRLQTSLVGDGVLELKLLRRGQSVEVELPIGPFARSGPKVERVRGVPVLRIVRFDETLLDVLGGLVQGIRDSGHEHLVVDLRDVAGGRAGVAYRAADLFVAGALGELKNQSGSLEAFSADEDVAWSGKIVVLINSGTQGAAEILATVLGQAAGARLVGRRTFGVAARQAERELSGGAILFLRDAFYTGPDGEPINSGLVPDERIDDAPGPGRDGEEPEDPSLERALDLLLETPERQAA